MSSCGDGYLGGGGGDWCCSVYILGVQRYSEALTCVKCLPFSLKFILLFIFRGTQWRSWFKHCATSRKVAGSVPDGVIGIFH
jgi:hypothetical protein